MVAVLHGFTIDPVQVILLRTSPHEGQTSKHLFAEPRKMTTSEAWGDASNRHQTLPMLRVVGGNSNCFPSPIVTKQLRTNTTVSVNYPRNDES